MGIFRKKEKLAKGGSVYIGPDGASYKDYSAYKQAKEAYKANVFAFRCVDIISKSVASIEWSLSRLNENNKPEHVQNHLCSELMERPNPRQGTSSFMYRATAFLLINGNTYLNRISPTTGPNKGLAKELYVFRPDQMSLKIDRENDELLGYERKYGINKHQFYPVDPITLECDILHVKLFDPLNDWIGMSITEPTGKEIDSSNDATNWNKSLLQNCGRPGMLFTSKDRLSDNQFNRLQEQLLNFSGPSNVGKNMILEGMNDVKPFGLSLQEFEFTEGTRELARKIALGWGVPPMLLGIPGDNTYSNYKEARQAFWEETVMFYVGLFSSELNNWLFSRQEVFLTPNLDDVPALAPKRKDIWDMAQNSSFLTYNQKLEMVGKDGIGEAGDVLFVSSSLVPIDFLLEADSLKTGADSGKTNEEDEEEKQLVSLLKEGYTEEEACRILGFPYEEEYV